MWKRERMMDGCVCEPLGVSSWFNDRRLDEPVKIVWRLDFLELFTRSHDGTGTGVFGCGWWEENKMWPAMVILPV